MGKIKITPEELQALIKAAVKEELADFFLKHNALGLTKIPMPHGNKKIEEFKLSARLKTIFYRENIFTLQDMMAVEKRKFLWFRGSSETTWAEMQQIITEETEKKDS